MAFLAVLGLLALVPLVIAASAVMNGWVLTTLWGWFIVPVFHLPELSIAQAIGLSLVIGFLTHQTRTRKKTTCEVEQTTADKVGAVAGIVLQPLFTLGIGWIIHRWFI